MSDDIKLNVLRAEQAGLVRVYFPNGSSFDGWLSACFECRHNIDDLDDPKPGRLTPPYECCTWGVMDRIYEASVTGRYGYGTSFHPPEDVEVVRLSPRCKRFTHKDDRDGEHRDPPPPDVPGQMVLGEAEPVVEKTPARQEAHA